MLEEYKDVYYCKKCKAMLIMWDENIVEIHSCSRFFASDGILETGDSEFLEEINTHKENKVICRTCRTNIKCTVALKSELFLQILKYVYRDPRVPDPLFKIDLKPSAREEVMLPPTLQEIKEAMVEELI